MMERVLTEMGENFRLYVTGTACLHDLRRETFDMLIVDWELPDTSGPEVIRWAREHLEPTLPILFITHRSEENDIVEGLNCGADDFMVKPLRIPELKARINALLRRAHPLCTDDVQQFGPYTFTRSALTVRFHNKEVALTYREFALAMLLFQNTGRLLSRDHLRESVWGHNAEVLSRSLDTHVSRLRQILQLRPGNTHSIAAVYGLGYRLDTA
ncbi:MAG: response regulator transcription factor [Comamonas sp.]|nr:response regulator transcription factor [Comamonas sp.]